VAVSIFSGFTHIWWDKSRREVNMSQQQKVGLSTPILSPI